MVYNKGMSIVSVIVITYNTGKALLETLDSIKRQSFKNIELIISDDASLDDTVRIAEHWLEQNGDVFVNYALLTSDENLGITKNINKGVYASRGKYVKIIGDDILNDKAIEVLYNAYEEGADSKVVWCPKMSLYVEEGADASDMKNFIQQYEQFLDLSQEEQLRSLINKNAIAAPAAEFFSKDMITAYGLYDERINYIEDWTCWIKLAEKGFCFKEINYEAVRYRVTKKSTSRNNTFTSNYMKDYAILFFKIRMKLLWKYRSYNRFIKDLLKCLYIRFINSIKG